jgi:hypothetical protein
MKYPRTLYNTDKMGAKYKYGKKKGDELNENKSFVTTFTNSSYGNKLSFGS